MGVGYSHARPFDQGFYRRVAAAAASAPWEGSAGIDGKGTTVDLTAGDLLAVEQAGAAQIVHLDAWHTTDPTERIWPHEISGIEGCFLAVGHRLWSTMPRFRPLLTVVRDTLDEPDSPRGEGRHHLVLSGWDVPATWDREGGARGVPTAWDRFRQLRRRRGVDPGLHRDAISLFQRTRIELATSRFERLPSLARPGDHVVLFAEQDVTVALVPSPWMDGGCDADECDGSVAATVVRWGPSGHEPLGWPTPGVPYPDIGPYLDEAAP